MIKRAMRWSGFRLGLGFVAGAGLLVSAAAMVPTAVADGVAQSDDGGFSSLYIEPIPVTEGVMLATRGVIRAAVVATRDAQGHVTIECRDEVIGAEEASQ